MHDVLAWWNGDQIIAGIACRDFPDARTFSSTQMTFNLSCSPSEQVADMKSAIEASQGAGFPRDNQVIIFQGKVSCAGR